MSVRTTCAYYVANKFAKGFIGTANVDTNSRLCMAASVAAQTRAFGADLVPGCYEDLDLAELVVLIGSNAAWCHPVLFSRMRAGAKVIVVDPRATATARQADLHLPIRPGTDATLLLGLTSWLAREDRLDRGFIKAHTRGFVAPTIGLGEVAATTRSNPCSGRCRSAVKGARRDSSRTAPSRTRTPARTSSRSAPAPPRTRSTPTIPWFSTRGVCATSGIR